MPTQFQSAARRAVPALLALALAGCSVFRVEDAPEPPPGPAVVSDVAPPEPVVAPPKPVAVAPPKPSPRPVPRDVVILFQSGAAGYAEVAAEIAKLLPSDRYAVTVAALGAESPLAIAEPRKGAPRALAVAVGREAVDFARERFAGAPLVFCQVFNYQEVLADGEPIWGVHSAPPLALQLRGWSAIDPQRRRIGLIVSEAQRSLVAEAAAAANGTVDIRAEVSSSDRETLYLFKRLVPDIDGFWLTSDNRILSPPVLRELLTYAIAHGVGVLVPNDALLQWGALASASGTTSDVARRVRGVVDRVAAGATAGLPAMTPLHEIELRVNAGVARELGVAAATENAWVLREPD
jgi:ABC-type uncharacterized transport system substrate-binding protein